MRETPKNSTMLDHSVFAGAYGLFLNLSDQGRLIYSATEQRSQTVECFLDLVDFLWRFINPHPEVSPAGSDKW
jgi:hypothetical protein